MIFYLTGKIQIQKYTQSASKTQFLNSTHVQNHVVIYIIYTRVRPLFLCAVLLSCPLLGVFYCTIYLHACIPTYFYQSQQKYFNLPGIAGFVHVILILFIYGSI